MVLVVSTAPFPARPDVHSPPFRRALAFLGFWVRRLLGQRGGIGTAWLARLTDGLASLQGRICVRPIWLSAVRRCQSSLPGNGAADRPLAGPEAALSGPTLTAGTAPMRCCWSPMGELGWENDMMINAT
jgi:hypothetical protein